MDPAIQRLSDIHEIRDLVLRYCRAVDRKELSPLIELYHEDATDDHGRFSCGPAREFLQKLPAIWESMIATSHQIMNHYIVVDGDYAEGEAYVTAYHLTRDEAGMPIEVIAGGRYLDTYERRKRVWKFKSRQIVLDWNQVQPSLSKADAPMFAGSVVGAAREQDPSWSLFRLIGK